MKPSEMMQQMKALLPTDSAPGTYFMAASLLRLPADMIDHIISKDFKDCTKMAEHADMLYSRRRGNTVAAVNTNYEAAGRPRPTTGGRNAACRLALGTAVGRPRGSASPGASGSRETEQLPRTKNSPRWHDFFTG
jgi:hypothetical protein